jgi:hypothetical protein
MKVARFCLAHPLYRSCYVTHIGWQKIYSRNSCKWKCRNLEPKTDIGFSNLILLSLTLKRFSFLHQIPKFTSQKIISRRLIWNYITDARIKMPKINSLDKNHLLISCQKTEWEFLSSSERVRRKLSKWTFWPRPIDDSLFSFHKLWYIMKEREEWLRSLKNRATPLIFGRSLRVFCRKHFKNFYSNIWSLDLNLIQLGSFWSMHISINLKTRIFYFPFFGADFSNFLVDIKLDLNNYSLSKFQVKSSKNESSRAMSNSKHKMLSLNRPWI